MSVNFVYRQKMDFSICAHKVGFRKFSHIYTFLFPYVNYSDMDSIKFLHNFII